MRAVLVLALLLSLGCSPVFRSRFDAIGEYTGPAERQSLVATPVDVRVFYASAPDGFTLRENELTVEPGFAHEILGRVSVYYESGACYRDGMGNKETMIRRLREVAHANGANAIIYVVSKLSDEPTDDERCSETNEPYGTAWAVVLAETPEPPAAAEPAPAEPAPAEPAPAAPAPAAPSTTP